MRITTILKTILGSILVLVMGVGGAQAEYPEKPITLILPVGAGGSHDRNSRVMISTIPEYLGAPMIVKLMPGASGQIGTAAAAQAKADGYTLLFTHNYFDQLQQHVKKLPYDTNKDFVPVAQLNSGDASLIVLATSPFKSFQDVIDHAQKNPGKLKFAHSGVWGAVHVPAAQLFQEAGIKVTMVPYKGGGPSMRGFLAGEADFTMQFTSTILAQGDKVRVLATSGDKSAFPGAQTFKELGYSDDIGMMRRVIMAPAGIPEDRLTKLRGAVAELQKNKTYLRLIKAIGENTSYIDGVDYESLRPQQSEKYRMLVKELAGG
jgi:tripartite-type tricarboxylate transporter receptor subunit TctC